MQLVILGKRVLAAGLVLFLGVTNGTAGETAEQKFYHGYYLEHAEGDFAGAAELYDEVVADRSAEKCIRSQAQTHLAACREELACADFAALMPPDTLAYVELNRPGDRVVKLLKQLGLLTVASDPVAEGSRRVGLSPAVVEAALGIRGAAVAITGFDPFKQEATGVAVFHPGDLEVIRGLLQSGLQIGGSPVEPIGGFETYDVEGEALVTLTSRLVVASRHRGVIEGVIRRLQGEEKGSLADNPELAGALRDREDSLLYFCVNAKPLMPMLSGLMAGAGAKNQELAVAQAVLDLESLQTFSGKFGIGDEGIVLDVRLRLDEEHQNLVYNLLRTPAIHRDTLKCIPDGAAAFLIGALNEAPSRFTATSGGSSADKPPVVTALDFGREIFANITSFAVSVLVPEGEPVFAAGIPIPDVVTAITVNDPAKSQALWTQVLGIGSLATGKAFAQGNTEEIEGVTVQTYRFPDHVSIFFAAAGNDLLIASTRSAIARSLEAKRRGKSVLDDAAFAESMTRLGSDSTQALFAHPARCARIAKRFMPPREVAEMKPVIAAMPETVFSAVIDHSDGEFRMSTMVTGLPDLGGLVAMKIAEERRKGAAHARLNKATKSGQWEEGLQAAEALLADNPDNVDLLTKKFRILAVEMKDREAALACADTVFKKLHNDATLLNNLAWHLLTREEYAGQYDDVALKFSKRSNELTDHGNWMFVDTLARAKFGTGDVQEAIKLQQKAIELSNGEGLDEMKASLARFEKGLNDGKSAIAEKG